VDNYKLIEMHKFNFGESAFPLIVIAEVFQNRDIYKLVLSDKETENNVTVGNFGAATFNSIFGKLESMAMQNKVFDNIFDIVGILVKQI